MASGIALRSSLPRIRNSAGRSFLVSHHELVSSIGIHQAEEISEVPIIPAIGPWLSGLAASFSKYRWRDFKVVYIPTCPATTKGYIHMGYLYDLSDSTPTNSSEISTLDGYVSGPIWAGAEGHQILSGKRNLAAGIASAADVSRVTMPWYPYCKSERITSAINVDPVLGNSYCPFSIVIATGGGEGEAASSGGNLYMSYTLEMVEPMASKLHDSVVAGSPTSSAPPSVSALAESFKIRPATA